MASMFSKPKTPSSPSQLSPINLNLPIAPGPRATPLPAVPAGQMLPTPGPSSVRPNQQQSLLEMLKQLGAA